MRESKARLDMTMPADAATYQRQQALRSPGVWC